MPRRDLRQVEGRAPPLVWSRRAAAGDAKAGSLIASGQDNSAAPPTPEHSRRVWPWWLAIALGSLALYAATANRGPQWQDSGYHILRVATHQSVNPLGLALSHPLHHWLGRLFVAPGIVEPCLAVTLVSALAAAVAVANVFGCVWTLTRDRGAALLAACSLGLANTFWQMATRAESYTLVTALLAAECWCVALYASTRRQRWLWGAWLCNGLGLANHNLALLTLPVLIVILVHGARAKRIAAIDIGATVGLWLIGSLPYTAMVLVQAIHNGDVGGALSSALFGRSYADEVLNARLSPRLVGLMAGLAAFNFPNLLLPVAMYGVVRARRFALVTLAHRALLAGLLLHLAFAVRYPIKDQFTFFLPTYTLLCIFGGVGFARIRRTWSDRRARVAMAVAIVLLVVTPLTYALAAAAARRLELLGPLARHKPYRDDYVYALIPWSVVERSAEQIARQAVELAGPSGLIVIEDPMAAFAVEYQVLRSSSKTTVVVLTRNSDPGALLSATDRAVTLVPMDRDRPKRPPPLGQWQRKGDLYVLTPPDCAATRPAKGASVPRATDTRQVDEPD